jgi:Raf kinase inhibitor-like YbhB/YbcL family protein
VLYDVPAAFGGVPENVSKVEAPQELKGAAQGRNDSRRIGYGGPCPPPGPAHRYFFKLYALAAPLRLKPGASKQEVERAMGGHILATAQLIGTYGRQVR